MSYFIESAYNRTALNPALRPNSSYIGFPLLTGMGAEYKTNTFNLDNFTRKIGNERVTFMNSAVSASDFLSNISDDNYLSTDFSYDVLAVGFYKNDAFWNINLGVKTHTDINLPKGFFSLLKEGFDQNIPTSYDLKGINATANSYVELGVSYSRPFLNNNLIVGTKLKLLGGIANFDLEAKKLSIEAGPDRWIAQSRVTLAASAPGLKPKYKEKEKENGETQEKLDGFDIGNWSGLSGYGLGFDIGAVYDFKDLAALPPVFNNLKASLSFTDIGFISWSKANSVHLASPDGDIEISPNDYNIHTNGTTSLEDIFDDVTDDLEQAIDLKEDKVGGRSTSLRTTMNVGLEYAFLNNTLSAGLLYSNRFGNYFNMQELTLSGNYRPKNWVAASLSYSFLHSNFNTFGGAIYLTPLKVFNLFVAGDYIIYNVSPQFVPSTSKALNLQFGLSIPM
ncbi:DUF5723 family protein [Viscerimonas tarda]